MVQMFLLKNTHMAGHLHDGIDTVIVSVLHHEVHYGFSDLLCGHLGAACRDLPIC